jgi:hypothetical protein
MLSAKDRFTGNGPWMRMDGAIVANDLADLIDGSIQNPINLDEYGNDSGNPTGGIATNTWSSGQYGVDSCTISSPSYGVTGSKNGTNLTWTHAASALCASAQVRYYCFEM